MKIFYIFYVKEEFNCYVLTVKKQKVAQRIITEFEFKEPLTEDEINMLEWACKNYKRY